MARGEVTLVSTESRCPGGGGEVTLVGTESRCPGGGGGGNPSERRKQASWMCGGRRPNPSPASLASTRAVLSLPLKQGGQPPAVPALCQVPPYLPSWPWPEPCPPPPHTHTQRSKYLVRASYLQIYNEVVSDLLKPERTNLVVREEKRRGIYVEGLSEWVVRSPGEVYLLMQRGQEMVRGLQCVCGGYLLLQRGQEMVRVGGRGTCSCSEGRRW